MGKDNNDIVYTITLRNKKTGEIKTQAYTITDQTNDDAVMDDINKNEKWLSNGLLTQVANELAERNRKALSNKIKYFVGIRIIRKIIEAIFTTTDQTNDDAVMDDINKYEKWLSNDLLTQVANKLAKINREALSNKIKDFVVTRQHKDELLSLISNEETTTENIMRFIGDNYEKYFFSNTFLIKMAEEAKQTGKIDVYNQIDQIKNLQETLYKKINKKETTNDEIVKFIKTNSNSLSKEFIYNLNCKLVDAEREELVGQILNVRCEHAMSNEATNQTPPFVFTRHTTIINTNDSDLETWDMI
ncbi:hypothetical protein L3V86_00995 [Thiotrichales bacterium 19S11-10]|nr:hypothetical protein [Thiotrichales bacterium 19S11-10]